MKRPLHAATFVVVDVETTGMSVREGGITEIAMLKVRNGLIFDEFVSLVNPEVSIPYNIIRLTGIDDEMVAGAPTVAEEAPLIREFLGEDIFTAHNAPFDRGFVNGTLVRGGCEPMSNIVVCTCKLARRLMPRLPSKSLGPLAEAMGIRNHQRHRAAGDAYTTAQILIRFLDRLENEFEVADVAGVMKFQ